MNHADARLDDAIRTAVRAVVAASPEPPSLPDVTVPHAVYVERDRARRAHWRSALAAAAVIALVAAAAVTVVDRHDRTTARRRISWATISSPTAAAATRHSAPQLLNIGDGRALLLTVDVVADDRYVVRASTYSTRANTWLAVPTSPDVAHIPGLAFWTGRQVVVLGGVADVSGVSDPPLLYDPVRRRWSVGTAAPSRASAAVDGLYPAVWDGDEIVLPGQALAYNPAQDEWRHIAPIPLFGRLYTVAVWSGHEVLVWAGCGADSIALPCAATPHSPAEADAAAYNPEAGTWRVLPPSPLVPRSGMKGVFAGGRLFVWGGYVAGENGYGATFDPGTNSWQVVPDAPITRRARFAVSALGDRVVIWGGRDATGLTSALRGDGATYDARTGQWAALPSAPLASRENPSAVTIGNSVLVWGGDTVEAPNIPTPPTLLHDGARAEFTPR